VPVPRQARSCMPLRQEIQCAIPGARSVMNATNEGE
jgi:hypothetical protein